MQGGYSHLLVQEAEADSGQPVRGDQSQHCIWIQAAAAAAGAATQEKQADSEL